VGENRVARILRVALLSVVVATALSSCSNGSNPMPSTASNLISTSVIQAPRQLVGFRWLLTEITTGNASLSVPQSLHATWQFTADQQFLASDAVNAISGRYRLGPARFTTLDVATTAVGYAGSDPVRLAVISGFQRMISGRSNVELTSSPTNVVIRVPGYVMTFRRVGPAGPSPPPSSTSR
jgi:hypothetical protein